MYYRIALEALEPEPSHTGKLGEDEFHMFYKVDRTNALNAIKMARDDRNMQAKLDLEKKAEDPEPYQSTNWELKDGLG